MNRRGFIGVIAGISLTPLLHTRGHAADEVQFTHKEFGWSSQDGFYTHESIMDSSSALDISVTYDYDPVLHGWRARP